MSILQQPPPDAGVDDPFGAGLDAMLAGFAELAEAPVWTLAERRLDQRFAQAAAVRAAAEEMMARLGAEIDDRAVATTTAACSASPPASTSARKGATA